MDMSWEFVADDELKIPENTEAVVTAIRGKDGEFVTHRQTTTGKDLLSVQFLVAEGEFKGRRASLTLWPDPNNFAFRAQVEAVTGIQVSKGEKAGLDDIRDAIAKHSFEVKLGVDRNGYTVVKYIDGRRDQVEVDAPVQIGESSHAGTSDPGNGFDTGMGSGGGTGFDDDDILF